MKPYFVKLLLFCIIVMVSITLLSCQKPYSYENPYFVDTSEPTSDIFSDLFTIYRSRIQTYFDDHYFWSIYEMRKNGPTSTDTKS